MDKLIITYLENKICTALLSEGRVVQMTLESKEHPSRLNNIYIGKVQKLVPSIQAAFVDIAPGTAGYYSLAENMNHHFVSAPRPQLKPGDEIVVQVVRDEVKTKAPVLSGSISLPGRYCVVTDGRPGIGISSKITDSSARESLQAAFKEVMKEEAAGTAIDGEEPPERTERVQAAPGQQLGVIVRTNAAQAPVQAVIGEYRMLIEQYEALKNAWTSRTCYSLLYASLPSFVEGLRDMAEEEEREIVTDQPWIYETLAAYLAQNKRTDKLTLYQDPLLPLVKLYSLDTVLERATEKRVWLKSGGYLVIEPTEAMVVIDVNTGKYSGKKPMRETIFRINREVAQEIARQLRLRNLSGIILVDFIDMDTKEDKEELLRFLGGLLRKDPVKASLVDMTRLGLVEITRKKVRKPLYEQRKA